MLAIFLVGVLTFASESSEEVQIVGCDNCKTFATTFIANLGAVEGYLHTGAEKICDLLPSQIRDNCITDMTKQLEGIFKWLQNNVSAEAFCEVLKECPRSGEYDTVACSGCHLGFQALKDFLVGDVLIAGLETLGKQICGILPSIISGFCTDFLVTNVRSLVTGIVDGLDPQKLCVTFGACKA